MLKVGIIGIGAMGYNHARIYHELQKLGKLKLIGISDKNKELLEKVSNEFDTLGFLDYKELLNQDLDVVSIVVPTFLHKEIALEFIRKGIHVLIEKPISDTIENAEELIKEAEKNNVILSVGHVERFNPAVLKLKEFIDEGILGKIVTMTAKRVGPMTPRILDTGVILDLAVHDIDVMAYLAGSRVKEVYAKAKNVNHPNKKSEDYALIIASFENNIDGIIETNRLTPHKTRSLSVIGTKGIAYLDYINQCLTIYDEQWVKNAKIEKGEPLKNEIIHFIDCVENNKKPLVSGLDGIHALKVALDALKNSKEE
ncbi:oxidoreductase domain protein [Methanococcus vannielii SB]|uniref:Oxidoreductase domain protein n=1 Tax=Methanococcus vannielii (strain ATCC 35089 / DSM 1224 / JCM 13029 / OCM 148 / SB) TaxID=406327 RepID=A6UNP2_METVS|nr:UDP-N-acetylglucosamine 3-dehydrogenase [Methanococcus vannielii]ABR54114.1 oxidoreductase domain protein [Methanococcus vannielii SB]